MKGLKNIYSRIRSFSSYNLLLFGNFILLITLRYGLYQTAFPASAFVLCAAYLLTGIGAYFFNDLMDISADHKAGKFNSTQVINKKILALLIVVLWSAGCWLVNLALPDLLPFFAVQLLLLVLYSVPVIRLKEKGITGLIADACYAHVIPVVMLLVLANDFAVLQVSFVLNLAFAAFCIGMRDILVHQVHDAANDMKSGVKTFASSYPQAGKYAVLFEALAAAFLLALIINQYLYTHHAWYLIMLAGLVVYYLYFYRIKSYKLLNDVSIRGYIITSSVVWLAFILLNNWYGLLVFIIHPYFISFLNQAANKTGLAIKYVFKIWIGNLVLRFIPLAVNVLLYYFFRVLGRDLKQKPLYKQENEFVLIKRIRSIFQ